MKALALLTIGMVSVCVAACGSANKGTSSGSRSSTSTASTAKASATTPAQDFRTVDKDKDNDIEAPYDDTSNTDAYTDFGRVASAPTTRAITALVKRYYAAAVAEDGGGACSMLYSTVAETVPEDYGTSPPGPPYLKGTTCPAVMTLSFKHFHRELAAKFAKLRVAHVRLEEHHGLVVLSFGRLPEREVQVAREGRVWKMESLLDHEVP